MFTTSGVTSRFSVWRRLGPVACGALLLLAFTVPARPDAAPLAQAKATPPADAALVARGEYLANKVAMCVQCHSTRDAEGNILESKKFRGGAIPVKSPWPNEEWAYRAPSLAGLPGFTDDQIIALLTEGRATNRQPPRRPMPPFRMNREDATAIVAYLRSF